MKQRIEPRQIAELSDEQKERLRVWWEPQLFDVFLVVDMSLDDEPEYYTHVIDRKTYNPAPDSIPLLSIGQCIQLLQENGSIYEISAPELVELNEGDLQHKDDDEWWERERHSANPYNWQVYRNSVSFYNTKELIDGLWEEVKEVLKRKEVPVDIFQFYNADEPDILYTANLRKGRYIITWDDVPFAQSWVVYMQNEVYDLIKSGKWIVVKAPAK